MLEREILEISAKEQRRIGQELHDGTQQQLTGLALLAQNVAKGFDKLGGEFEAAFAELQEKSFQVCKGLEEAAAHVNLLSRGLIPVEVDAEGLRSSLTELTRRLEHLERASVTFTCDESVEVLNNFTATHLYRIAQEAVNNALKHSRADFIGMSLTKLNGTITLKVLDNGVGIPREYEDGLGMGLRIMAYRAELIGSTLNVCQAESGGTEVTCTVSTC